MMISNLLSYHCRVQCNLKENMGDGEDKDPDEKILELIGHLPEWIKPEMVFPDDSIEKQQLLGRGHYGCVYRGLFKNGNAV